MPHFFLWLVIDLFLNMLPKKKLEAPAHLCTLKVDCHPFHHHHKRTSTSHLKGRYLNLNYLSTLDALIQSITAFLKINDNIFKPTLSLTQTVGKSNLRNLWTLEQMLLMIDGKVSLLKLVYYKPVSDKLNLRGEE